jgi:DHA1 family tetracycline resistance protein-like MFS transporter
MAEQRQAAIGFIFVTVLVDVIGFGIIIPVIPSLIRELIHGDISQASLYGGWLMFAYSITQFLCAPVLGNLSDQFGRRPVLLASLFGFGIDYLVVAFAPTIAWLFVGRIIAGITGGSFTTASAYIADISTPEKRAQNFGMVGAAFGLGFIIGPVLGGLLGQFGSRIPFFAAAALALLNWLYGYFILPESLSKENRRKFEWKRANPVGTLTRLTKYPLISGLIVSFTMLYIAGQAVQSTWTFYTIGKFNWDQKMVGYSLGVVGITVAIVQGGLIRIINPRLGAKRSIYLGFMLSVLGQVLFAYCGTTWLMFVSIIPYCLGGIAGPALQGEMSNQVPPNEQGELQGGLTSLMSASAIVGPLLMTSLFSYFTGKTAPVYFPGAPFMMGALLTFISLLLTMRSLKAHFASK